jgi:FAD/FMN-containing dehydrogenase
MTETIRPETEDDVTAALADALAEEAGVEIVGAGSKRALGNPVAAERVLDMSALSGITLYEPEELVLSARAATPMAEITAALAEKNQRTGGRSMAGLPARPRWAGWWRPICLARRASAAGRRVITCWACAPSPDGASW